MTERAQPDNLQLRTPQNNRSTPNVRIDIIHAAFKMCVDTPPLPFLNVVRRRLFAAYPRNGFRVKPRNYRSFCAIKARGTMNGTK